MVKEIRFHIEGHSRLHSGFQNFLAGIREAARSRGVGWTLSMAQGRAVRDFMKGLRTHPNAFHVLLIDSDGPPDDQLRENLHRRADWSPPRGSTVSEEQEQWMVQVMESWFLADRDALRAYYRRRLHESALPPERSDVEEIPKRDVIDGLKRATDGGYHKTAHAPAILERLNPEKVRERAPNCNRLFDTLLARLAD
jgi:hypothetical protein